MTMMNEGENEDEDNYDDGKQKNEDEDRHDICQMFYTSTVSKILKFTREKAHKSLHFRLLIWNFGIFD